MYPICLSNPDFGNLEKKKIDNSIDVVVIVTSAVFPSPSLFSPRSAMLYDLTMMLDGAKHHFFSYVVDVNFHYYGIVVVVSMGKGKGKATYK